MGIKVEVEGVRDVCGEACALAQRLRGARSAWDGATRDGESACGLPVAREAFRTLQDAWFTEVGAHATVLEELCAALHESAETYQRTDQATAETLRVADGGQ